MWLFAVELPGNGEVKPSLLLRCTLPIVNGI